MNNNGKFATQPLIDTMDLIGGQNMPISKKTKLTCTSPQRLGFCKWLSSYNISEVLMLPIRTALFLALTVALHAQHTITAEFKSAKLPKEAALELS